MLFYLVLIRKCLIYLIKSQNYNLGFFEDLRTIFPRIRPVLRAFPELFQWVMGTPEYSVTNKSTDLD